METKQFDYIVYLRVIAMLFIIAAHTICTPVIYYSSFYSVFGLNISVILTNFFRTGVTIFIMISGALFLRPEKEVNIKKMVTKNVMRIFLCLLIFGTFFSIMEIVFVNKTFRVSCISEAFFRMLQNQTWGHLWYLYMLIGLYVVTPILKIFINNCTDGELFYFLIILVIFNIFIPFLNSLFNLRIAFSIPFVGTNIFFYLLGYVLHSKKIVLRNYVSVIGLLIGVLYLCVQFIYKTSIDVHKVVYISAVNFDFLLNLIPISIFSISCCRDGLHTNKIFNFTSDQAFGVYIFHAVFINFIYKVLEIPHIFYKGWRLLVLWILVFFVTLILSSMCTSFLRMNKFIKKWIL